MSDFTPYRSLHGFRARATFDPVVLRGHRPADFDPSPPEEQGLEIRVARKIAAGLPTFNPASMTPVQRPMRTFTSRGRLVMLEERTPVSDQGGAGSCTANGRADALELVMPEGKVVQVSRRDIYWRSRWQHGDEKRDSGSWSHISAAVVEIGVARESLWPYKDKLADIIERPTLETFLDAARHKLPEGAIRRIAARGRSRIAHVMAALDLGCPVTIDADVGRDFCEGPDPDKAVFAPDEVEGGHCWILCGYWEKSDGSIWLRGRNSWGRDWCDGGYCWLDQSYIAGPSVSELDVTTAAPLFEAA